MVLLRVTTTGTTGLYTNIANIRKAHSAPSAVLAHRVMGISLFSVDGLPAYLNLACLSIYLPSHHCCRISDTIEMDGERTRTTTTTVKLLCSPIISRLHRRRRSCRLFSNGGGDQHLNTAAAVEGGGAETEREARALRAAAGGRASAGGAPWGPFLGVTTDARFRLTVVVVVIQVKCFSSGGRRNGKRTLNQSGDGDCLQVGSPPCPVQ